MVVGRIDDETVDVGSAEVAHHAQEEVAPAYYARDAEGLPARWIEIMRRTMQTIAPRFGARRMVKEYVEMLYRPGWDEEETAKSAADIPAIERAGA